MKVGMVCRMYFRHPSAILDSAAVWKGAEMLVSHLFTNGKQVRVILRRNIGVCAPVLQKATDPIQQLFVDKIREYAKKSSAAGGKLVEPTPEIERELATELEKVAKQYGGGEGVDMTQFPTFKFKEPEIDPINLEK